MKLIIKYRKDIIQDDQYLLEIDNKWKAMHIGERSRTYQPDSINFNNKEKSNKRLYKYRKNAKYWEQSIKLINRIKRKMRIVMKANN